MLRSTFRRTLRLLTALSVASGLLVESSVAAPANAASASASPNSGKVVGALSGVEALVFEGNRTFSRDVILFPLRWRLDFHAAGHPSAPLDAYLEMLRARVLAGYQRSGFAYASVTARADAASGKVRVEIREGTRYTAGRLRIEGLSPEVAAQLQTRLVEAPATSLFSSSFHLSSSGPTNSPAASSTTRPGWLWVEGRPAPSDPAAIDEMRVAAERALAELNRHGAKVRLRLVPQPGQAVAELVLEVTEPGTPGVLEQIEIKGLKRDSRDALLSFLALKPGMELPPDPESSIAKKLWSSARYLHHDVTLSPLPERGRYRLDLDVNEWTNAPAIDQPLAAEDKARLKFHEWLLARDRWTHDLVATVDFTPTNGRSSRVELVLVPDGVLMTLSESSVAAGGAASPESFRLATVLSAKHRAFYSPGRQRKLTLPRTAVALTLAIDLAPNPRGSESPFNFQIGLGWKSRNGLDEPPFQVTVEAAPVAMLALGRTESTRAQSRIEGGVLHIVFAPSDDEDSTEEGRTDGRIAIDAATGRLLEMTLSERHGETGVRFRIGTEEGAFARRLERIAGITAGHREAFDPARAWASSIEFVASEIAALPAEWFEAEWMQAVGKVPWLPLSRLLAGLEWDPIATGLQRSLASGEADWGREEFPLILETSSQPAPGQAGGLGNMLAGMVLNIGSAFWTPGSWPAAVWRDGVLLRNGYSDLVLRRLSQRAGAEDAGPLECLFAVIALSGADVPLASRFLEKGLAHLRPTDGVRDLRALMEGGAVGPQLIKQLANGLAAASETDVGSLGSYAGPGFGPLLRQARDAVRARTNEPPDRVLIEAAERGWTNAVEAPLRAALESNPPGVSDPRTSAGQFQRGMALARGEPGKPGDLAAAIPWFRRAAEGGYAEAQMLYGDLLRDGQGVDRDMSAAMRWYRKAAEQDVPHAGCRLGVLLASVEGVERDVREAERWFRAEMKHGCGNAAFQLGMIALQGGSDGKPDWNAALPWFRRAWDLDHAPASYLIAKYHGEAGRDREAMKWLEKAARKGILEAQSELGDRLSDGLSPGQDPVQACAWLRLAVKGGHRVSQVMLRRVESGLTEEQRAEAGRRADAIAAELSAAAQSGGGDR